MADRGEPINKYAVHATFKQGSVTWVFSVETAGGDKHQIEVLDGAEIPILLDLVRRDKTVYFDGATRTLSTGWNDPGE